MPRSHVPGIIIRTLCTRQDINTVNISAISTLPVDPAKKVRGSDIVRHSGKYQKLNYLCSEAGYKSNVCNSKT